jgi:hypothetical protein
MIVAMEDSEVANSPRLTIQFPRLRAFVSAQEINTSNSNSRYQQDTPLVVNFLLLYFFLR